MKKAEILFRILGLTITAALGIGSLILESKRKIIVRLTAEDHQKIAEGVANEILHDKSKNIVIIHDQK